MSLRDLRALCDRGWVQHAACRHADPDLFMPSKGDHTSATAARVICRSCPVSEVCLQWALDNDERDGIWGGMTAKERGRMRRNLKAG